MTDCSISGEKPYVCDICGSRHTRKGELLLHVRCIHTHERPFQCAYCPKNFQRRDLLRKHERIHTDTRPYGCEFCGKTFTARDKMIGGLESISNEFPPNISLLTQYIAGCTLERGLTSAPPVAGASVSPEI